MHCFQDFPWKKPAVPVEHLSSKCPCADLAIMILETGEELEEQICLQNWQILTAEDVEINHIQISV